MNPPNAADAFQSDDDTTFLNWASPIFGTVEGGTMREAGMRCGLKDSAALDLKRRIAADLIEYFGEDVIRRRPD